jgi:hypothetical protein
MLTLNIELNVAYDPMKDGAQAIAESLLRSLIDHLRTTQNYGAFHIEINAPHGQIDPVGYTQAFRGDDK